MRTESTECTQIRRKNRANSTEKQIFSHEQKKKKKEEKRNTIICLIIIELVKSSPLLFLIIMLAGFVSYNENCGAHQYSFIHRYEAFIMLVRCQNA